MGHLFFLSPVLCFVAQSCLTLFHPTDCSPPGSPVHGDSPGKNTGVGGHALLQGIFPTQGSNPGLPHCGQTLYHLSHQGRKWQPTPVFLPGESHGQKSLMGYTVHGVAKSWTRLSSFTSLHLDLWILWPMDCGQPWLFLIQVKALKLLWIRCLFPSPKIHTLKP